MGNPMNSIRTASRKRLALIDGASLHESLAANGVREVDAAALFRILRTRMPGPKELLPPIITMLPKLAENGIGRAFTRKGFEVLPSTTQGEKDDDLLCQRIEAVNAESVGQIVMVSSDSCYLRPLWDKHQEGVSICWFIAESVNANGNSCIGRTLRRFLSCKMFTWVDMKPFVEELRFSPT